MTAPQTRVLFINSVPGVGGAEASMLELAANLDRERFSALLMTTAEGSLSTRFRALGWDVERVQFPFFSRRRPWIYTRELIKMIRIIRHARIDLLHINCDRAVPQSVLAAKLTGRKVLCHIHDMTRAWFLPQYVRWLNRSDRIVANSQATAECCKSAGMRADKLQVIFECFEYENYKVVREGTRSNYRAQWGVSEATTVVGLVGQILPHKGHLNLLQAANLLRVEDADLAFVIVGDDQLSNDQEFYPTLLRYRREHSLTEQVKFVGHSTDIPGVMAGLDIAVVPSWEEPFGRVVVEAMASGLPVIATRAGGIPEILDDGQTGLLIPPRDPVRLSGAILTLHRDPSLRMRMGALGRVRAERFDIKAHTRLFERTYQAVLQGKAANLSMAPFESTGQ